MGLVWLFSTAAALLVALVTAVMLYRILRPARKTYAVALGRGMPTEPQELDLDAEHLEFTFPDGSQSPGWIIAGHDPDGPAIVISHGWSDSRYGSLLRAPYLVPFASKVVIYDLRAHGDNTAPVCKVGTVEVEDLLAVIEQAVDPQVPVVLFGSSLGAGVSIVAAAKKDLDKQADQRLARISGVIADGPYRRVLEPIVGYMRYFKVFPYPAVWLAWVHIEFWHGGLRGFDRVSHAEQLDCPLLVMHGTQDCISSYDSGRAIAEAATEGTLVTFEDGGHSDLAWKDPQLYRSALESFFADLNINSSNPPSESESDYDTINTSATLPK